MLQFQKGMLEVKTDIISQIITKTKTENPVRKLPDIFFISGCLPLSPKLDTEL